MVLAAAIAAAAACSQQGEPKFGQQDATKIRQRTQAYAQAFNGKEAPRVITFFSGETVFMPPNAPTMRGREAVADYMKRLYADGADELVMESKDVGGAGTLAFENGTYSLRRRPATGDETRDRGKYMVIWRFNRAQNAWLMDYMMWSSDLPEAVAVQGDN
jgi:ketosteroid isomerase-like protein